MMLDIIMLTVLAVCCGTIFLFVQWCHKQIESEE